MDIHFLQARNYQPANRQLGDVLWIVLHSTESAETEDAAAATARYFNTTDRKASTQYIVDGGVEDNDAIWQCVYEKDVCYGAKSANAKGIHIEQVGMAGQTREQWLDAYGQRMLPRVAELIRGIAARWHIPFTFVTADGLKLGLSGITTHNEVNKAWPSSGHTDPGPNYPMDILLSMLTQEEDLTPEEHDALVRIDADTDPIPAMNAAIGRIETAVTQPGQAPVLSDADVERVAKRVCDMLQLRLQS